MKNRRLIIWIIVVIVMGATIISGLLLLRSKSNSNASVNNSVSGELEPFLTYKVEKKNMGDFLSLIGQVNANVQNVRAKISGEIVKICVQQGQRIKAGDVLGKIDNSQYRLQYITTLNNYNSSLSQASATIEEKKLSLEIAKKNLDNTEIKAPISGIIENINVATGDMVGQNSVITTIVDDSCMKVNANIDEIDLSKVKVGQEAEVVFDQLNNAKIEGHISFINPSAVNSGGLTVIPIEVSLDGDPRKYGIINGIDCTIDINLMNDRNVLVVPNIAIQKDKKGKYVTVKTDSGIKKAYVKVGQQTAKMSEILSGLKEGDILIIKIGSPKEKEIPSKVPDIGRLSIPSKKR